MKRNRTKHLCIYTHIYMYILPVISCSVMFCYIVAVFHAGITGALAAAVLLPQQKFERSPGALRGPRLLAACGNRHHQASLSMGPMGMVCCRKRHSLLFQDVLHVLDKCPPVIRHDMENPLIKASHQ